MAAASSGRSSSLSLACNHNQDFSATLVGLGFEQARLQSFDWLESYPGAAPLFDAIQTSFSPRCVLTIKEAKQLSTDAACEILNYTDALNAHSVLAQGHVPTSNLRTQRSTELQAKRKQLQLLKVQRDVLREMSNQSRWRHVAHPQGEALLDFPEHGTSYLLVDKMHDGIRGLSSMRGSSDQNLPCLESEGSFFAETLSYGQQLLQQRAEEDSIEQIDDLHLSVEDLVKSYGEIKASKWAYEARLERVNTILTSLTLPGGAYLDMPSSTMPTLIRDIRNRAAKALEAKCKRMANQAADSLRAQVHTISLWEVLREQSILLDVTHSCARYFLEQRFRLICLSFAVAEQDRRYRNLLDALQDIASSSLVAVDNVDMGLSSDVNAQNNLQPTRASPFLDENVKAKDIEDEDYIASTIIPALLTIPEVDSYEDQVFKTFLAATADIYSQFSAQVGLGGTQFCLESHPQFSVLVDELDKILRHNTSVLESVLQKRSSQPPAGSRILDWSRLLKAIDFEGKSTV